MAMCLGLCLCVCVCLCLSLCVCACVCVSIPMDAFRRCVQRKTTGGDIELETTHWAITR